MPGDSYGILKGFSRDSSRIFKASEGKLPKIKGAKNLDYNEVTGRLTYTQSKPPKVLGMMEKIHKAKSSDPLYFLNIFFGVSLLFFVLSSYWMFLRQTAIFKKAIYFTLAGLLLAAVIFVV